MDEQDKETNVITKKKPTYDADETETEDEEVKRNCYGKKFYTTTSCSDEDDDDGTESLESSAEESKCDRDEDKSMDQSEYDESSTISTCSDSDLSHDELLDSDSAQPRKFTFDLRDCEPGTIICRPKPIAFKNLQDYNNNADDDCCSDADDEEEYSCHDEDDEDSDEGIESSFSECDSFDECSAAPLFRSNCPRQDEKIVLDGTHDDCSLSSCGEENDDDEFLEEEVSTDTESTSSIDSIEVQDEKADEEDSSHSLSDEEESCSVDLNVEQDLIAFDEQEDNQDDVEVKIEWGENLNDDEIGAMRYVYAIAISGSGSATDSEGSVSIDELESGVECTQVQHSEDIDKNDLSEEVDLNCCSDQGEEETHYCDGTPRTKRPHEKAYQDTNLNSKRICVEAMKPSINKPPLFPPLTVEPLELSSDYHKIGKFKQFSVKESPCTDDDTFLVEELLDCISPDESNSNYTPSASPVREVYDGGSTVNCD